jgi:hypothetical protein
VLVATPVTAVAAATVRPANAAVNRRRECARTSPPVITLVPNIGANECDAA